MCILRLLHTQYSSVATWGTQNVTQNYKTRYSGSSLYKIIPNYVRSVAHHAECHGSKYIPAREHWPNCEQMGSFGAGLQSDGGGVGWASESETTRWRPGAHRRAACDRSSCRLCRWATEFSVNLGLGTEAQSSWKMLATKHRITVTFFTLTFAIHPPGRSQAGKLLDAQPFLKAKKKTKKSYATFGRSDLCKPLGLVGN